MKTLTLWQPWATLIARGEKRIETRSWSTKHRGLIAIHAAAKTPQTDFPIVQRLIDRYRLLGHMPLGEVICLAVLVDVKPTEELIGKVSNKERLMGDYSPGRFGYLLEQIQLIKPVTVRGMQRIWNWQPRQGQLEHIEPPRPKGYQEDLI